MHTTFPFRLGAFAGALLALTACGAPLDSRTAPPSVGPVYHVAARDALNGTTTTQGDFNLAHRGAQVAIDGRMIGEVERVGGLQALAMGGKIITDRDTGRAREAGSGLATGRRMTMRVESGGPVAEYFLKWRKAVLDGKTDRKSMSVIFHNDAGEEAGRAVLFEAWPVKWSGPALNARNSGHATEKIEIAFERIEMK
jgi:phage tail-like protein